MNRGIFLTENIILSINGCIGSQKKKKKGGNEQITGWSLLNSLFFFQNVTAWSLLQYLRTEDDNYECKNRRPHVENN